MISAIRGEGDPLRGELVFKKRVLVPKTQCVFFFTSLRDAMGPVGLETDGFLPFLLQVQGQQFRQREKVKFRLFVFTSWARHVMMPNIEK